MYDNRTSDYLLAMLGFALIIIALGSVVVGMIGWWGG